jgi:hypothetical protein
VCLCVCLFSFLSLYNLLRRLCVCLKYPGIFGSVSS